MEVKTALINAPSRKIFRPMFKARWQNMQNIINDSSFIDMVPEPYKSYYIAFVEQCLQWSRGFVPMLHRSDFFSTGMGYTVCEIFARECLAGGYRLESTNKELKTFMEAWAKADNLDEDFSRMFFDSNAGGNSILVLTPVDGEIYAAAYPKNRFFFQIGRNGKVSKATILNRFSAGEDAYYAKEQRIYMNGEPYYRVKLAKGTLVVSPTWQNAGLPEVPEQIAGQWAFNYGDIKPNKWYKLPLKSIGVYNIPNKPLAAAVGDLPGYSDSTLYTALDVLYSIDYNYTQAQVDMYMGKTMTFVPKQLGGAAIETSRNYIVQGQSFIDAVNESRNPLEDQFVTAVSNGIDGKPIQPTMLQPDLRGEAHKYIRDSDLELLASKVGLSSSTLANHLVYNHSKTATEVNSEQDTTESSVNIKRRLASTGINDMLCDVAAFYGFTDKVEIVWGRSGINTSQENQALLADYQAGVLPIRQYLKKRWSDLSEEEIEKWAAEIETEAEKKSKRESFGNGMFNDSNYFGDEINEDGDGEDKQGGSAM